MSDSTILPAEIQPAEPPGPLSPCPTIKPIAWGYSADKKWERLDPHPLGNLDDGMSFDVVIREAGYAESEIDDNLNVIAIHFAVLDTPLTRRFSYYCEFRFSNDRCVDIFVADFPALVALATVAEPLTRLMHQEWAGELGGR